MENIAIVGGGLVGALEAILLAKRGYKVSIFERRQDLREANLAGGRSINLALSNRGWKGLEKAGIKKEIEEIAIPMYGRMMHPVKGELTEQLYGKEGEAIFSVSRGELNRQLLLEAGKLDNVDFYFNHRCTDIDLEKLTLTFINDDTLETYVYNPDIIIGADGAFSAVRGRLQITDRFNYSQYYLEHGYKELSIPPNEDGSHKLDKNHLHIWPRGAYMLIALANLDGSFTCTLFFPFEGTYSFESLKSEKDVNDFFKEVFPDAFELMPTLTEDYFENPTSSLVTIKCSPWNYKDKILLIGDAAHAIVPFYGQGMNAGFEDCFLLEQYLDKYDGKWAGALPGFAKYRKADGDAIADLAIQNFIEMRDKVADEKFLLQKKIEKKIYEKHPDKWVPLYSMVTFNDNFRYSDALIIGKKQDAIMNKIMERNDIVERWNSREVEDQVLKMASDA